MRRIKCFLTVGLALSATAITAHADSDAAGVAELAPVDRPGGEAFQLTAQYSSRVLIFPVGDITFEARLEADGYHARSRIEAAGLAALFTDFDITAEVEGDLVDGGASPTRYAHVERTGRKVRAVEVTFDNGLARSVADPPFGSWGVPPASEVDRMGTLDPMTAFVALSERLTQPDGGGCNGELPVFDGKARYNLRLETVGERPLRTRGWRGDALLCNAWYVPIAGYDPEDYPSESELSHPLRIWLAPLEDGRYYLPVRLYTRAGLGGVSIELTNLSPA